MCVQDSAYSLLGDSGRIEAVFSNILEPDGSSGGPQLLEAAACCVMRRGSDGIGLLTGDHLNPNDSSCGATVTCGGSILHDDGEIDQVRDR